MSEPDETRPTIHEECPDCHATEANGDSRVIMAGPAGARVTWHTAECPGHAIEQILLEDGTQRWEARQARAKAAFPAAHERLKAAARRAEVDPALAAGFVAAFSELVQNHADGRGGCYHVADWVEMIERHFPDGAW
jgi:hypothetical protein